LLAQSVGFGATLMPVHCPHWTSGVSDQTVRVGVVGGNHSLDGSTTERTSVTFDIGEPHSTREAECFGASPALRFYSAHVA